MACAVFFARSYSSHCKRMPSHALPNEAFQWDLLSSSDYSSVFDEFERLLMREKAFCWHNSVKFQGSQNTFSGSNLV